MHFVIGVAYWAQRQMEPAEKAFKDAYKENPNDAMTNLYLGDIAVRYQRSPTLYHSWWSRNKRNPTCHKCTFSSGNAIKTKKNFRKQKTNSWRRSTPIPVRRNRNYLLARVYRELHDTQASAGELSEFERLS